MVTYFDQPEASSVLRAEATPYAGSVPDNGASKRALRGRGALLAAV